MGHQPTEEELYRMMNEGDLNGECKIGFEAFMKIILNQKQKSEDLLKNDIVNAFVALGGIHGQDGEVENGKIDLTKIKEVIKREFNVDIDLNKLGIGNDNDGQEVDFKAFMELMSS
jgi:Ca2+-binding EF-hand superfamily protein